MQRLCNRLTVCVSVLLLTSLVVRLNAAAPTLGQHGAATNSGSTSINSATSLTNGSTIIVGISQTGADSDQTYTVADDVNGAYTSAVGPIRSTGANGTRTCQIFYFKNIATTAGALTITATYANGTALFRSQYVEVLGASTSAPLDQVDSVAGSADANSHAGAASLTTAVDPFVYMVYALNATITAFQVTTTTTPDFITLAGDFSSNNSGSQYYSGTTALSADTVAYGTTGAARTSASCTASFVTTGAATNPPNGLSLMGVGL